MLACACMGIACAVVLIAASLWRALGPAASAYANGMPGHDRASGWDPSGARRQWPWSLLSLWPASALARLLSRWLPDRPKAFLGLALERADLDSVISADQWLIAPLACGMGATLAGVKIPASGNGVASLAVALLLAGGGMLPWWALRDRIRKRQRQVLRELPGYLDLLALALEAGCGFGAALQLTVQRSPASPLRSGLERVLHEVRAGSPRSDALRRLERRLDVAPLGTAVAAIVQAEATGVSLAPVMRAQARRCTQLRFARAEKLAMEAPVKMLGPLVLCIFPCTFIVIGFPIAVHLLWAN
jgi:tight adherence protein C